jgi:serine/threonine protein kinase
MSRNSPISMAFKTLFKRLRLTKSAPSQRPLVTSANHQSPSELNPNTVYDGSSNKADPTGADASSPVIERSATADGRPEGALKTPQPQAGSPSPKRSTDGPDLSEDGNARPRLMSAVEATSSSNYPANPHLVSYGSGLLSNKVKCDVILVYNEKEYHDLKDSTIEWLDPSQYKSFDKASIRVLREHGIPEIKQLYRKSGRCRLINDDNHREVESRILEDERQWSEVLQLLITSFFRANPYVPFHLEIRWEYSDLAIGKVEGERYAITVQRAIEKKLKRNWQDDEFVPRKDLVEIFSESTIKELINNDRSIQLSSDDKEKFIEDVTYCATRLLAVCVYADLPLACLYHLIRHEHKDIDLPLTPLHCPEEAYSKKFRDLLKWQCGFIAHEFDKGRPKHRQLKDKIIVPIMFDKVQDKLGEGGFGMVYKVYIDPDHHFFSPDRNRPYALKIFKELGSRTELDFKRESETLSTLSTLPHPHITPHLASWTQDSKFYMLFPCAETHLGQFLRTRPNPELDNTFVLWLLQQLKGLADGVRHIHNLGPSGLGPEAMARDLRRPAKRGRTGFHHDLKPQNILVFADDNVGDRPPSITDLILKISDFGTAKISNMLSHSVLVEKSSYKTRNLSHGDTVYGAPDFALMGETSRPYDVWSLGCIFLEILLWTFGLSDSDLNIFEFDRLLSPEAKGHQSPAYWCRDDRGKVLLKPAVVQRLKRLQDHCKGRGVFEKLVSCTAKMLTVHPNQRPTALYVYNVMDTQLLQAQVDLTTPDFYRHKHKIHEQDEVAAPPTVYPDTPRSPSIDERSIYAPDDGYLRVDESRKRRPSLPSNRQESETKVSEHQNGVVTPDRRRLSPVVTQDIPPAQGHRRSPSITVSDHEAPFSSRVLNGFEDDHEVEGFPPVGSDPPPLISYKTSMGREDFSHPPRHRSPSNDSRRTQSSDF